jgi:plasmid stability protein
MPTLYVRNVPQALYEALRERARANHRSIAAEVLALLEENIPTAKELRARQRMFRRLVKMRTKGANSERAFPSTEEMLREDRSR